MELPVEYTGGIIAGDGFIREFYQHMSFQYPHCYEEVLEFKFNGGKLEEVKDKSKKAEEARRIIRDRGLPKKEITRYIREAFSLFYRDKKI